MHLIGQIEGSSLFLVSKIFSIYPRVFTNCLFSNITVVVIYEIKSFGKKSQKVLMSMDNYQRLKSIELREWHWHNLSTFTSMETSFRIFCPSATSTTTSTMTSFRISSLYTMSTMNVRESFWLPILTLLEVIWNVVSFLEV